MMHCSCTQCNSNVFFNISKLNLLSHLSREIAWRVIVRGEGGVAGKRMVVGEQNFTPGLSAPCQ